MRLSSLIALTIAAAGPDAVDSILPPLKPEPEPKLEPEPAPTLRILEDDLDRIARARAKRARKDAKRLAQA